MKATAHSQKLIQQEEFREELSGNKEKSLTFHLFSLINTISIFFSLFVCYRNLS